jgi:dihydroorotate dehydrogenase
MALYDLARPLLFALPPEAAHRLSIQALRLRGGAPVYDPRLRRRLMGIDFPNPLGMAAGYDKGAEAIDGVLALGFGFAEIGTVTPQPQPGNPQPRMFRLLEDRAVVNRLGFNSEGAEVVERRLAARPKRGVVGVNIGANKDSADRLADYVSGVRRFAPHASYLMLNISSPNTAGLRDLQGRTQLAGLLRRVKAARDEMPGKVPLVVKVAPDLADMDIADIAEVVLEAGIDGIALGNTTLSRSGLRSVHAVEAGGMSGRPLFRFATIQLAKLRKAVGPGFPVIGVGGVDSGETAWAKLEAGADLVQLYTGLVYVGPHLPAAIVSYFRQRMRSEGLTSLDPVIGRATEKWAAMTP